MYYAVACNVVDAQDSLINNSHSKSMKDVSGKSARAPSCDPDSLARLPGNQLNKCSSLSECRPIYSNNNEVVSEQNQLMNK